MVLHRLSELNIKILSYEKQSGDLEDKSTDWFLYDQACTFLYSVHTRELALITFYSRGKIAWKNVKFVFTSYQDPSSTNIVKAGRANSEPCQTSKTEFFPQIASSLMFDKIVHMPLGFITVKKYSTSNHRFK